MNRFVANFSGNSRYNSLPIPVQLMSIKEDIAKLKKMSRAAQGRLMKAYERLKMNTKLEPMEMLRNNGSGIIDLGKLFKNLKELKEIFKNYREVRTRNNGEWNTFNKKRRLIDQIEKKIDRTLSNIIKQQNKNFQRSLPLSPTSYPNLETMPYAPSGKRAILPRIPPSYGGSLFVNVKGVGKRKVRYYKNGNKYVLVKGKKKKI